MNATVKFRRYASEDSETCLGLFDANCPEYFAPNERADYVQFLNMCPSGYELCLIDGQVAGAFGLVGNDSSRRRLKWIMLNPRFQGLGAGRAIMKAIAVRASNAGVEIVDIAASQKSAPFFARFNAVTTAVTRDGWGPGMHRVDMEMSLRPEKSKQSVGS
ncbi:MAG: GNAT family N-acetyltransferase [Pseudomonadota bacterium]